MQVFLIHGMGRTSLSMWILARRLRRAGHRPRRFGYSVSRRRLRAIADRFAAEIRAAVGTTGEPFAVVGHSLGNVITRLASTNLPPGFERFVMLAPPNRPPSVVNALGQNPLFRLVTRDSGRKLADADFFASLPVPAVPSLVIAGTRGPRARWLPFRGTPNDGIVRVEETLLEGVPAIEVNGVHTFLMNRSDVFAVISDFLAEGFEGAVVRGYLDAAAGGGGGAAAARALLR